MNIDYRLKTPIALHAKFEIRGFTALLGRSGAGKTSLLRALAGLLPAEGVPWAGVAPEARPVGYLPQNAALFPHLNVLHNTAYGLRGPDRLMRAATLLRDLGIAHLAHRHSRNISGGEAQRVALARALARQPELLLLDEPSAGLDATTRDDVLAFLIEKIEARSIPALAATHDPAIAAAADWIVLLAGQKIIRQGTPGELFGDPRSVTVAKLLGYRNFWSEAGTTRTIRADEITIVEDGRAATIVSVRPHGGQMRLICEIPETIMVLASHRQAVGLQPGGVIHLRFAPEATKILTLD